MVSPLLSLVPPSRIHPPSRFNAPQWRARLLQRHRALFFLDTQEGRTILRQPPTGSRS